MKTTLSWGARNAGVKYAIREADLEGVVRVLNASDEAGSFWGHFDYAWKGNADGEVTSVTVSPTSKLTMPTWPAYRRQPQTCKDAWDSFYRALQAHEDGHRDIFESGIAALVRALETMNGTTKAELEQFMKARKESIQAQHDRHDTKTDHGKNEGTTILVTEPCRSKPSR